MINKQLGWQTNTDDSVITSPHYRSNSPTDRYFPSIFSLLHTKSKIPRLILPYLAPLSLTLTITILENYLPFYPFFFFFFLLVFPYPLIPIFSTFSLPHPSYQHGSLSAQPALPSTSTHSKGLFFPPPPTSPGAHDKQAAPHTFAFICMHESPSKQSRGGGARGRG